MDAATAISRTASLTRVLATPSQPMVLLGEIDELEVQREGAQHPGLVVAAERSNLLGEARVQLGVAAAAGIARRQARARSPGLALPGRHSGKV
jgi:hypothetical protein